MGKSHVAGRVLSPPTSRQMKEFWAQVDGGLITGENLQTFFRGDVKRLLSNFGVPRVIFGDDFISPQEIAENLGDILKVVYGKDLLKQFTGALPSQETLRSFFKDDFLFVAGPPTPLSLFDIWDAFRGFFGAELSTPDFRDNDCFFKEKVIPQWLVIRKKPRERVPEQQEKMEDVPSAPEAVWIRIVLKQLQSIHSPDGRLLSNQLLSNVCIRTSSVLKRGSRPDSVLAVDGGEGGSGIFVGSVGAERIFEVASTLPIRRFKI